LPFIPYEEDNYADPPSVRAVDRNAVPVKVLLVEDNVTNRVITERMLALLHAEVTSATNGRAAVNIARDKKFDLVLMDCKLPILDGFGACREIRAGGASSSSRIVAFTASWLSADRDRARAAGMSGFLGKPFGLVDLQRTLDQAAVSDEAGARSPELDESIEIVDAKVLEEVIALLGPELDDVCAQFAADAKSHQATLRDPLADLSNVARAAHALGSAALLFGLSRLGNAARDLEARVHEGGALTERLRDRVASLVDPSLEALPKRS
jgi:CheY-like chemotaxis protein/HPt (histidine-containing phosphotransfer) domain-containing protein